MLTLLVGTVIYSATPLHAKRKLENHHKTLKNGVQMVEITGNFM